MKRDAGRARPFQRPMGRWWRRNPTFRRYMLREATAVGVAVYALELGCGIVCLALGEPAWNAWRAALRMPASLLLHGMLLGAMIVHAVSWFQIMPKTMPMIVLGGRRLAGRAITVAGWTAALLASLAILAAVRWLQP